MLSMKVALRLAAALAFADIAGAQAADISFKTGLARPQAGKIPAKYRGVYDLSDEGNCQNRSADEHMGEFPWIVVTATSVHSHETVCDAIAVQRNVKRNVDQLTSRCFSEGDKSIMKEHWSLELETKEFWGFRISQPYLSKRRIRQPDDITSGRFKKCNLQAVQQKDLED